MTATEITRLLGFANLQMAAEAFLSQHVDATPNTPPPDAVKARLETGNTHSSKFTPDQAIQFTSDYEVLAQYRNDPLLATGSGFSGTLFRTKVTDPTRGLVAGELTLSFRSSEFIDDAVRDGKSTNQLEIKELGWAFGQIAEMEAWYAQLRADPNLLGGKSFNVTGYSLGGHLATAFNILRREAEAAGEVNPILSTYTFNGAGVGDLKPGVRLTDVLGKFNRLRAMPDITQSAEWIALQSERTVVDGLALARVDSINQEAARVSAGSFIANFAFDARPPIGEQGTWRYQVAALLAGRDTIGSSLFFGTDVNTIPTTPKFAEEFGRARFANMIEIVASDAGHLGPSWVSNSGIHYGSRQEVYIEDQPLTRGSYSLLLDQGAVHSDPEQNDFADTHSLALLVDSLSLMAALEGLSPDFTFEDGRQLLAASSNSRASVTSFSQGKAEGDTLERTLDAFRDLLLGPGQAQTVPYEETLAGNTWHLQAFREPFHANLDELNTKVSELRSSQGAHSIRILSSLPSEEIEGLARHPDDAGLAMRYSLRALNAFSLEGAGAIYEPHNATGVLDLFAGPDTTPAGMTDGYIADRAAMLGWLMYRNENNAGDVFAAPGLSGPVSFTDLVPRGDEKPTIFRIVPQGSSNPADLSPDSPTLRRFVFGTDSADNLEGGAAADALYGGLGTDVLHGRESNDSLEGGVGLDLYAYSAQRNLIFSNTNDGADIVRDTDGRGLIRYTLGQSTGLATNYASTVIADASDKRSDAEWRSADGRFIYTTSQGTGARTDLTVTFSDGAGGSITLADFHDGDFGIHLGRPVGPPAGEIRTFHGDKQNWDSDPDHEGIQPQLDAFGNYIRADGQDGRPDLVDLDRPDQFVGSAANEVERFATSGGNDIVHADGWIGATGGADLIEAGSGRDIVWSGPGDDFVEGGADGSSTALAESGGDVINSGSGNDAIYGYGHAELATAIRNSESETSLDIKGDFLSAGAGDDLLIGTTESDALLGGAGDDVLVGGAGSDNLWGDLAHESDSLAWSAARSNVLLPQGGQLFQIELANVLAAPVPTGGADVIYGGAGDDWAFAGGGDDFIDAGSGADVVFGDAGSDILLGGSGNDTLSGDNEGVVTGADEGGDYLEGGAGDDKLFGNGGEDILSGGPGSDTLVGGAGKDIYIFDRGDGVGGDFIFDAPADGEDPQRSVLVLGDGLTRDRIRFFPGSLGVDLGPSDPNDLGSQHDVIHFQGFDRFDPYATPVLDAIHFADGTSMTYEDILAQGFDVDGTEGPDNEYLGGNTLIGTAVRDRIRGFGGYDLLAGLAGDDLLDAGDGTDELQGGDGNDTLLAGAGPDRLFGQAGDDSLLGGGANDALVGDAGADTLSGEAGVDSAWGGAGDDFIDGGDDNDTLYGDEGADTLDGGSGDDTLYAHNFVFVSGVPMLNALDDAAADVLRGGSGNDYLNSGDGADQLEGGSGDDLLEAEGGDDSLSGGEGADDLFGGDGNDVLTGGAGNDALSGGAGADWYVFHLGDAYDTIYDEGANTVTFAAGIAAADLVLWQTGADLHIGHNNGLDALTVANWYVGAQPGVSEFEFSNGDVWTAAFAGADAAKTKRGTPGNDTISGGAIDEAISGFAGDDALFGNAGADTISGGTGADTLSGGDGADSYAFGLGDGRDVVVESGQGADVLYFGTGISKSDILVSRTGNDLILAHKNGADALTVKDWFDDVTRQIETIRFDGTGEIWTASELTSSLLVITGTAGADFLSGGNAYGEAIVGLAGNDELHGGGGDDSLTGGLGNDALFGEAGNDCYFFVSGDGQDVVNDPAGLNVIQFGPGLAGKVSISNSGVDRLISFSGTQDSVLVRTGGSFPTLAFELNGTNAADTLVGSEYKDIVFALGGNDSVKGGWGIDEIHGGPGNDTLEGGLDIDELWGDAGDDVLDGDVLNDAFGTDGGYTTRFHGGPGADTLYGHVAADSYYFDLGDGQDLIVDEPFFSNAQWHYSLSDELVFGAGIFSDAIAAHPSGNDLVVDVNATDRITLRNWLSDPKYRVDRFRFSDGSSLNESQIADLVNVRSGTAGNDLLVGSDSAGEKMYGRAGDDTLRGLGGDDILDGGTGNDVLDGAGGNDTYAIRAGDGADLVRDSGGSDAIVFGPGIHASDLVLERFANNLIVREPGGDSVSFENLLKDPGARVETFLFADGSTQDTAPIVEQLTAIRGTAAADSLNGTAYVDQLSGLGGNDTLAGAADDDIIAGDEGDDLLLGGAGADFLAGGPGIDRYVFNPGDGADTITDPDSGNLVQFGAGIAPQNVVTARVADDLALSITGTADRISIPGYFTGYAISQFRFADGSIWTVDTIKAKVTSPTSGADTLIGFETNDVLSGLAGADTIYGRAGNDTLDGGLGSDTLFGEEGNDTLIGGSGESKNAAVSNSLFGGSGDDVLIGGGNANSGERLDGGPGSDLLLGGVAQEIIDDTGYDGRNSLLFGGAATDTMRMYGGAAAMAIGASGNDRISGGLGTGIARTRMIVAFNKADGIDTVDQLAPGSTITVGGGTLYSNLSLEVSSGGLRLKTGSSNYVHLSDWYSGVAGKSVATLQVVIDGTRDYKPASSNPLNNAKIVAFDFIGLVNAFDAARASGKNFDVAASLPAFRLWSSDTQAIGGVLSYEYAKSGSLGTLTNEQMRAVLDAPAFGIASQSIAVNGTSAADSQAPVEIAESQPANGAGATSLSSDRARQEVGAPEMQPANRSETGRDTGIGITERPGSFAATAATTHSTGTSSNVAMHESAWRRISRDLPALLDDAVAAGTGVHSRHWRPALGAESEAMRSIVPAVGIIESGHTRLQRFEGLTEGFARVA